MKKFILPLLVLLFVGSLFAVESDPSEVVGYVKYDLVAGDNTIALPMDQGFAWASELGDLLEAASVGYFDSATQLWTLINAFPWGGWDGDFALTNGQALWVNIGVGATFYSIGELPVSNPSYSLVAGDNMIMLPLNKSDLNFASLVGDDIGASSVGYFDSATQLWTLINAFPWGGWDSDFAASIGNPLWINTTGASVWPARASSTASPITGKKN